MANKAMIGLGLQEDVSQGMQKIEDSIEGVSGKSKELAMIGKRIDDVSKKSLPARRELKQLQDIMASMNLKGLANTDEFTKAAVRAGELKDALSDTRQAVRAYSDDVMTLQAGAEVFQGIAAAGSIATSAMALFGTENEKVNQILLKVQAAQGLLNGVTAIANLLNKDSVIMLKLKQVQMAINSATTKKDTVLTTANTVAQTANTVATKGDTVAQTAWNTAKAIGNALLGNFSSLVLVGIGALATYAVATSGATDEQNKLNDEVDKGAEAQKGYKKVMADTYASLMTSFEQLKKGWNSLKTTHEKNKWITDNKNKLDELDLSINKVADAENVFNRNTSSVVASFIKRAKAAARLAELTDLYRKQMELLDKRSETLTKIGESSARARTGITAVAGQPIPKGSGNYSSTYGNINAQGQWVFSEQGAKNWNNGVGEGSQSIRSIDANLNQINNKITNIVQDIAEDSKSGGKGTTSNKTTKHDKKTTNVDKVKFAPNSLDDLNDQLDKAKKRLSSGLFKKGETQDSIRQTIADLEKQVNAKKIELGLELSDEAKKTLETQKENAKKLEKANEEFNNLNTTYDDKPSSYDSAIKKAEQDNGIVPTNQDKLDAIRKEMDYNDELIAQLEELKDIYESLGDVEGLNKVNDALGEIKSTQDVLSTQAEDIADKTIKWDKQQKSMQEVADTASSVGSAFNSLGNAFSQVGEEGAAAAFQIMGSVAQMVSDVIPQIIKLIGAKKGEAMASGVASAAPLKFPANIGAIATIVATIASTFASIMSSVGAFADGGIIGGGSKIGDHMIARVNAGEMILNGRQQSNLFKMINDGQEANKSNVHVVVSGKVRGKDLELVLANLNGVKKLTSGGLKF